MPSNMFAVAGQPYWFYWFTVLFSFEKWRGCVIYEMFIRTTTSSIHTEAVLAEVTMSMTKNTMVRGKKGKGWLKIMGNRTASAAAAAGAAHICSLL